MYDKRWINHVILLASLYGTGIIFACGAYSQYRDMVELRAEAKSHVLKVRDYARQTMRRLTYDLRRL